MSDEMWLLSHAPETLATASLGAVAWLGRKVKKLVDRPEEVLRTLIGMVQEHEDKDVQRFAEVRDLMFQHVESLRDNIDKQALQSHQNTVQILTAINNRSNNGNHQ